MARIHRLDDISRGTTYTIQGFFIAEDGSTDITGATIFFTIKSTEYDSSSDDTTALVKKTVTDFPNATGGEYAITINPSDTATLAEVDGYYDIKIKLASGVILKLDEGKVRIDASPTNRES